MLLLLLLLLVLLLRYLNLSPASRRAERNHIGRACGLILRPFVFCFRPSQRRPVVGVVRRFNQRRSRNTFQFLPVGTRWGRTAVDMSSKCHRVAPSCSKTLISSTFSVEIGTAWPRSLLMFSNPIKTKRTAALAINETFGDTARHFLVAFLPDFERKKKCRFTGVFAIVFAISQNGGGFQGCRPYARDSRIDSVTR